MLGSIIRKDVDEITCNILKFTPAEATRNFFTTDHARVHPTFMYYINKPLPIRRALHGHIKKENILFPWIYKAIKTATLDSALNIVLKRNFILFLL
jgi:hypothetical protein